jgi:hypothetical protein
MSTTEEERVAADEGGERTFNIDVAVHRSDPEATTDSYHVKVPGFEAKWSGDIDIARGLWAYLWKEWGHRLIEGMGEEELRLFSAKLGECTDALESDPALRRAAVSLEGTRAA